jgi:sugar phosphate isomerase/epimerase
MRIGISTASLYPLHTEDALLEVAKLGVKNVEIFLNSISELSGEIFSAIEAVTKQYDLNILAVHPFSSPMETLFLFSSYDRRVTEIMDLYKRYFEMMNRLDSKLFVLHGVYSQGKCSDERYAERLSALIEAGRSYGIVVAQENVSYCRSGKIEFLEMLIRELGDSVKFVLDVKQARRSGVEALDLVRLLGSKIVHLHMSDADEGRDCLPIGKGNFDFAGLFAELGKVGYKGDAVMELYRENYGGYSELADSVAELEKML